MTASAADMPASRSDSMSWTSVVLDHWRSLRPAEVLLMTSFPMAGFLLSRPGRAGLADVPALLTCLVASFCVAGSAYVFNSLEGLHADRLNHRLADHALVAGRVTESSMRGLMIALGVVGLAAFAWLGPASVVMAAAVLLWGYLYSGRRFRGKERPGISSLLHCAGAASFFFAGAGSRLGTPVPLVGAVLLAILFATGHLHHEIVDYEADREAGLRTLAVRYGVRKSLWLGSSGFLLFYVLVALAWYRGWWPASLAAPFLLGAIAHAVVLKWWLARTSEGRGVYTYRSFYRVLFLGMAAVAGILYLATG